MISSFSHCLIFAAGIAATLVSAPTIDPRPAIVATGSTPISIEVDSNYFATPTPDAIEDFAERSPLFVA